MNRHFRSQVRLSGDGKLTRNRANSNFHPQTANVILAPICDFVWRSAALTRSQFSWQRRFDVILRGAWGYNPVGHHISNFLCITAVPEGLQGVVVPLNFTYHFTLRTIEKRSRKRRNFCSLFENEKERERGSNLRRQCQQARLGV